MSRGVRRLAIMSKVYRSVLCLLASMQLAIVVRAAEEKIKPEELPKSVSDTVRARFPDLKFTSITKETEADGQVVYDIELKHKDRKFETDIKADGTMVEVEKEVLKKDWLRAMTETIEAKYPK